MLVFPFLFINFLIVELVYPSPNTTKKRFNLDNYYRVSNELVKFLIK